MSMTENKEMKHIDFQFRTVWTVLGKASLYYNLKSELNRKYGQWVKNSVYAQMNDNSNIFIFPSENRVQKTVYLLKAQTINW